MCLSNGAINALGEAKIVSIDNEATHAKSLAGRSNSGLRTENGEQRKYVHIALGEIMAHPEDIEMDKAHGGIRVKKCPGCGSENVDRYTVQYCRCCKTNAWYGQPGLRADANVKDAQSASVHMNHSTVTSGDHAEKQDAFDNSGSQIEQGIEISNRIENAIDRADRQIKIANKKQNIHPVTAAPDLAIVEKQNLAPIRHAGRYPIRVMLLEQFLVGCCTASVSSGVAPPV